MSDPGSITQWLQCLKAGDTTAAANLWERFCTRLKELVRPETCPWMTGGAWDESDVALSAFALFCKGLSEGRYHSANDREDLWRLLATIALRKARDRTRLGQARKRSKTDQRKVVPDEDVLETLPASAQPPDVQMMMHEECQRLLSVLPNPELQALALLKLEGYSNQEAADSLGYTRRTIQRMLALIRSLWEPEHDERARITGEPTPDPGAGD